MNYTREQLYNLSIYEVRKIGQLEGVKSPTSLKKDELIDEIIAISSGEKERYIPTSKKGRPSKAFKELDFLRNFEIEKEENKTSFFDSSLSICSPNLEEQAIYKMATEPVGEMEGFVDIVSSGFGILREKLSLGDDFVFLTSSLIKENNIKRGDFIKVSVLKLGDGKKFADKIISGPKNATELEFMNLSAIYPGKVLNFKNNGILNTLAPVGAGQRVLISCKDENLLEENMFKLFDQIDIKKFFIIFGVQPEEKEKYKNSKNIICIENEKDIPLIKLAVNILHREAETGADCVLFILGVEKINLEEKFTNLTKELTRQKKQVAFHLLQAQKMKTILHLETHLT